MTSTGIFLINCNFPSLDHTGYRFGVICHIEKHPFWYGLSTSDNQLRFNKAISTRPAVSPGKAAPKIFHSNLVYALPWKQLLRGPKRK